MSAGDVGKRGASRMPGIFYRATGDIRHRLWSLYWLCRLVNARTVVELGTRGGDSTRALLAAMEDLGGTLYSFDIEDNSRSVEDAAQRRFWSFNRSDSVEAVKLFVLASYAASPDGPTVDLVFIDTDHTQETTRREIAAWAPLVKQGGCIVLHDYWLYDPPRDRDHGRGVKIAVDEFCDANYPAYLLETHDAGPDGDTGLAVVWRQHLEVP